MAVDRQAFRDRAFADLIAAPLRSPLAFHESAAPGQTGEFAEWNATEEYVRARAKDHSKDLSATEVDEETAIEDAKAQWEKPFGFERVEARGQYRVMASLIRAGRNLLQPSGRHMILRICRDDPGREILRWRFISLTLPTSILLAAGADSKSTPAESVRISSRSIAPDGNVAELHVHHAAMMTFEDVWASLHRTSVVMPGKLERKLRGDKARCPQLHFGDCPERLTIGATSSVERARHMTEWADLLRQSFIARYILRQHSWHDGIALKDCKSCNAINWQHSLRYFVRGQIRPYHLTATPFPWPGYQMAMERRWNDARGPATSSVQRRSSDPAGKEAADERSFLNRAFTHVRCLEEIVFDTDFEALLLQYLRVKTAVFGLLVHAPGERGLDRFLTHFSQIKVYALDPEKLRPQPRCEPGLSVAATEYRVAPDAWLRHHRRMTRANEEGTSQLRRRETSWLIHLKRDEHGKGLPLFGAAVRSMEADGDRIVRAIESQPAILRDLRGIDIAGVEGHQPLWASAETLRRLRRCSHEVASRSVKRGILPFGLTLHVGEDFGWLTSGLRAIAEPIQWGMLLRGDRLGHAIAITIDSMHWWERRYGRVIQVKRIGRLLDLAFLAVYAQELTTKEEEWLAFGMRPIIRSIWGEAAGGATDANLVKGVSGFWEILGTKATRILMTLRSSNFRSVTESWLCEYLWNRSVQDRAHEKLCLKVEESPEISLAERARRHVIFELARRQICIESNPTSNLVVGGLDSISAQEVLHRRIAGNEKADEGRLPWTISTDDPITFSTSLADEYAYAWAGMVLDKENPCDPCDARALLDEAAATSMRMRFASGWSGPSGSRAIGNRSNDHAPCS